MKLHGTLTPVITGLIPLLIVGVASLSPVGGGVGRVISRVRINPKPQAPTLMNPQVLEPVAKCAASASRYEFHVRWLEGPGLGF